MLVLISDQDLQGKGYMAVIAQSASLDNTQPGFTDFKLFDAADDGPIVLGPVPSPVIHGTSGASPTEALVEVSVPPIAGFDLTPVFALIAIRFLLLLLGW